MSGRRRKKVRRLTKRRREIIHDLAVAQGIAACKNWGMGRRWYPKAIKAVEDGLIERFKAGRL